MSAAPGEGPRAGEGGLEAAPPSTPSPKVAEPATALELPVHQSEQGGQETARAEASATTGERRRLLGAHDGVDGHAEDAEGPTKCGWYDAQRWIVAFFTLAATVLNAVASTKTKTTDESVRYGLTTAAAAASAAAGFFGTGMQKAGNSAQSKSAKIQATKNVREAANGVHEGIYKAADAHVRAVSDEKLFRDVQSVFVVLLTAVAALLAGLAANTPDNPNLEVAAAFLTTLAGGLSELFHDKATDREKHAKTTKRALLKVLQGADADDVEGGEGAAMQRFAERFAERHEAGGPADVSTLALATVMEGSRVQGAAAKKKMQQAMRALDVAVSDFRDLYGE